MPSSRRYHRSVTLTSPYHSPLLTFPRATEAQGADAAVDAQGVAWHYGNPLGEQRWAGEGGVVVDRSHRTVLEVSGPDAAAYLTTLLSQKLDDAPVGFAAGALNLDAHGHVLQYADVLRVGEERFLLDLPASDGEDLAEYLRAMVFWSNVEITEADLGLLTVLGAAATEVPQRAGVAGAAMRAVEWRSPRVDLLVPRAELPDAVRSLTTTGIRLAGLMAFTAERVRALEPERATDLDAKSIPHEVPHWIGRGGHAGAVHLNKGCYRGQETVARVENLGRSPRVLVMLQLDGSVPELPAAGTEIRAVASGRKVGRLGTVVQDCEYGPIALALLKRSALNSGPLAAKDCAAQVDPDSLPTDEGEQAGRSAIRRLKEGPAKTD